MPNILGQKGAEVRGRDRHLVMLRAKSVGGQLRKWPFIGKVLPAETDGEGADLLARLFHGEAENSSGIDPAAQENADRHVGDHVHLHRF